MKKKFLTLAFLLFISIIAAQEFDIGLKGGLNFPSVGDFLHLGEPSGGGVAVIPYDDFLYKAENEASYHFGGFANININRFFVRPEINYTYLAAKYSLAVSDSKWEYEKIDIPILAGYRISQPVAIYAGPVISTVNEVILQGVEAPIEYEGSSINAAVGVIAEIGRFGIDFRYEYGISKTAEQRVDYYRVYYGTNVGYLQEYNLSQFIVSVHINILRINSGKRDKRGKNHWNKQICF